MRNLVKTVRELPTKYSVPLSLMIALTFTSLPDLALKGYENLRGYLLKKDNERIREKIYEAYENLRKLEETYYKVRKVERNE